MVGVAITCVLLEKSCDTLPVLKLHSASQRAADTTGQEGLRPEIAANLNRYFEAQ